MYGYFLLGFNNHFVYKIYILANITLNLLCEVRMDIEEKIAKIKEKLPIDKSYDIIGREVLIQNKQAYFVFVDGFAKDDILYYFLETMQECKGELNSLDELLKNDISYIECEIIKNDIEFSKLAVSVLSGMFGVIFEDFDEYILLDTREYPVRSISESSVEKVLRGAKDSFVETIVFNTALIRRRVRTEKLVFEMEQIGNYSKTDIAISYIDGLVDKKILEEIKFKIKNIKTNAIILGAEYIEDFLFKKKWYNPLPLVKYTERPDVASAYLSEGHIVLIIDTCPVAIILPVSIFHFMQHIGDYNIKYINGTITKCFRFLSAILMTFLAPLFVYISDNTEILKDLSKKGDVPDEIIFSFFMQILILEIAFLILQFSSLHIPIQIAPLIGVIGGLLLGDISMKLGIFTPLSLLCMVITVVTTYSIPSIEFSDALRIFRFFMILCVGLFSLYGLVASILAVFIIVYTTETIPSAKKYTYPLIPFNYGDLKSLLFRENAKDMK